MATNDNFILRHVNFYTDGAWSSKSDMGGWASICVENDEVIDIKKGNEPFSTNNRMELNAFLAALEDVNTIETGHTVVTIFTDSAYIANCINEKWYSRWMANGWHTSDRQEVKNQDLWLRIVALYLKLKTRFSLQVIKVKSHTKGKDTNSKYNALADKIAVECRKELEI